MGRDLQASRGGSPGCRLALSSLALALAALAPWHEAVAASQQRPAPSAASRQADRAAATPAGAADRVAPEVDPLVLESVVQLLSPPAHGPEPDLEKLRKQLLAWGPGVVPVVCGMLCGDIPLPAAAGEDQDQPIHPRLLAARHELLLECLQRLDAAAVVAHLAERGGGNAPLEVRLAAARLLGPIEHARALEILVEISEGVEPIHLERAYVQSTFERSMTQQLVRLPDAVKRLDALLRRCRTDQAALLARAAAAAGTPATTRFLGSLVGRDEALDRIVVRELARGATAGAMDLDAACLGSLRALLRASDAELRRLAAATLGAVGDVSSFEALAWLLESRDPLERETVRRSLQRISGVDLGPDSERWTSWQRDEQEWWASEGPRALHSLRSRDPRRVHAALTALLRHPLRRDEITEAAGPLLSHDDAAIAAAACRALARLGSPRALPWLVDALAEKDDARRETTAAALRELTGLQLPADYLEWSRALGARAVFR